MGKRGERQSERTLVCVIQALMGLELLVELRNDLSIRGFLDDCDNAMNVIIKDAMIEDVEGCQKHMPLIFVRGSNIRFVHIPDNVNIMQAVEERVSEFCVWSQTFCTGERILSFGKFYF